jgi:glycosyltransferase involved in cell wall biosynthesis
VHAGTPKASLLGMLAAWAARVPVRIYAVKGLRLETALGWKRRLLRLTERITAACATRVFCVGPDLARVYAQLGFVSPDKLIVFRSGMLNGLDAKRFHPESFSAEEIRSLRRSLGIPDNALVFGFVGRFVRDKGLVELNEAFEKVRQQHPQAHLLLVGDFEQGDPLPAECVEQLRKDPRITLTGFVADTARYYQLMDVHVLPTYREGFPNSPMEAAAAEVPTVGFVATGMRDAVVHNETGMLVPCGDITALAAALERYASDATLRQQHGAAARLRVETEFAQEPIWQAIFAEYVRLLNEQGIEIASLTVRETVNAS